MDIISLKFVILTIASVFIFYLINYKYRIAYLAILSCGFIASFNYLLLPYIIVYTLINYFIGLKLPDSKNKVALFRIGVIFNISQLVLLKYASFALDPFFQIFNSNIQISKLAEIIVPVGISYFTLQGIGYLINVKMGWEKPERKFQDFLLYITFFPKFLSGPIERSNHFLPQLKINQVFNSQRVTEGLRIALFGLFKKVAIANQLAPYVVNTYADINSADGYSLWILLLLLPLYLYFDFSGYTDIAIGFAKAFGIDLLPNFNRPFFSENVTTFWKRFHISLASWFNDYVFKQTSFKYRKWGIRASIYSVFLTFLLFGIWHGAGWNFMILGLLQALAINFEFLTKRWRLRMFSKVPDFFRIWFGRIVTYIFYGGSLVIFFSPDINSTFLYFSNLFEIHISLESLLDALRDVHKQVIYAVFIFMAIFLLIEYVQNDFANIFKKLEHFWLNRKNRIFRWATYYLVFLIIYVLGNKVSQFIYFQF